MSDLLKKEVVAKAIKYINEDVIIGVGSGTTVNFFIEALAGIKHRIEGVVPASKASEQKLKELSIPIMALTAVSELAFYFDGADEVNTQRVMIKGGGGALTREKIISNVAKTFICMVHDKKKVTRLGNYPIALEVIPMARSYVARQVVKLGGSPEYRQGFVTDNGNIILDVYDLPLERPIAMEESLKLITGVVESGLFAKRIADVVL